MTIKVNGESDSELVRIIAEELDKSETVRLVFKSPRAAIEFVESPRLHLEKRFGYPITGETGSRTISCELNRMGYRVGIYPSDSADTLSVEPTQRPDQYDWLRSIRRRTMRNIKAGY